MDDPMSSLTRNQCRPPEYEGDRLLSRCGTSGVSIDSSLRSECIVCGPSVVSVSKLLRSEMLEWICTTVHDGNFSWLLRQASFISLGIASKVELVMIHYIRNWQLFALLDKSFDSATNIFSE